MTGKGNNKTPQISNKTDSDESYYNYTVSEGSDVRLDVHDLLDSKDIHDYKSYACFWKQIGGPPVIANFSKDDLVFSFKAPYITDDNEVKTQLNFELTVTGNKNSDKPYNANVIVKRVQRAIIFQGGVSLGAYEAGVFKALVEKLEEHDSKTDLQNQSRPLFDIVAGTSIGAMNAAIVVSDIKNHKSWKASADDLVKFWKEQEHQWTTYADFLDMNPLYRGWWDTMHNTGKASKMSVIKLTELYSEMNPYFKELTNIFMNYFFMDKDYLKDYFIDGWYVPASSEAARRYYSAKQFHTLGAPNVATGILPWSTFGKYFDFANTLNLFPRPDNKHFLSNSLKKTLEHYVSKPIKTARKNKEPRFLSITVDVQTGDAVTFDSYEKKNPVEFKQGNNLSKYYSEYGNTQNKHIIFYNKGIEVDHILASGTFPGFFDYPKFEVENIIDEKSIKEKHIFWDGGFRSNTPLREIMQSHRDYWLDKAREEDKEEHRGKAQGEKYDDDLEDVVPDLEIYIADLWPSELKEDPVSFDNDFVENRKSGIIFGDKTDYDEQVANVVTDYIDLTRRLKSLAERKGASKEIDHILNSHATSINTKGKTRIYKELLEGRFRITKVVRIDHKDDGHEVGNKIFDYSYATIEKLMKDGYHDALIKMAMESIKDEFIKLDDKFERLNNMTDGNEKHISPIEEIQKVIQQIQNTMKIEDDDDETAIMHQVDHLIIEVSSISDLVDHGTLKEEKASLVDAAKQFQESIKMKKKNSLQPKISSS